LQDYWFHIFFWFRQLRLQRSIHLTGQQFWQGFFDFKVEFEGRYKPGDVRLQINGKEYSTVFGRKAEFVASEKGKNNENLGSALILRAAVLSASRTYEVKVSAGNEQKTVRWDVYKAARRAKARNVIFFLGDSMSIAHRTSARIMSKGMTKGKANGHHLKWIALTKWLSSVRFPPIPLRQTAPTPCLLIDRAQIGCEHSWSICRPQPG